MFLPSSESTGRMQTRISFIQVGFSALTLCLMAHSEIGLFLLMESTEFSRVSGRLNGRKQENNFFSQVDRMMKFHVYRNFLPFNLSLGTFTRLLVNVHGCCTFLSLLFAQMQLPHITYLTKSLFACQNFL